MYNWSKEATPRHVKRHIATLKAGIAYAKRRDKKEMLGEMEKELESFKSFHRIKD